MRYIEMFTKLTGRMPSKIRVPLTTYNCWSTWRVGEKPNPEADWADPSNRSAKVCGIEVIITDYFAME